jgi:LytR cell envelope-related transcriptional attenuator
MRARRPGRSAAIILAAAVTVAAVVAVVLALATPDTRQAASPKPPGTATPAAPSPRWDATVAVLNGTAIAGLAREAADNLEQLGFREGLVTNDPTNQQRQRTAIYYEPGYRDQAEAAATCIDVPLDRLHPMTAGARVVADRADIAVFIGADKAK